MLKLRQKYHVAIVGGGPVGLFLAIAFRKNNIDCILLEKRIQPTTHSRSLGIHPVSLELMEEIGIAKQFLNQGIKIKEGTAWNSSGKLGTLSFSSCPGSYPFILSLPQYKTEQILEEQLQEIDPDCLIRGAEVEKLDQNNDTVSIRFQLKKQTYDFHADILVGCDGKESFVRQSAGFSFEGTTYTDTYIMGDFSDNTELGSTAGIFLCDEGLIESFPLTENRRRWVIKTNERIVDLKRGEIEKRVSERIGYNLTNTKNFMLSSFGVQRYLANPMARNRVFLAGDAAHIVSPIGGQGMNLGWLDAWKLFSSLKNMDNSPDSAKIKYVSKEYHKNRTQAAKKTIRRAEMNMMLGRKSDFPFFKNGLVWLMLNTPIRHFMARIFTMRGLDSWPV